MRTASDLKNEFHWSFTRQGTFDHCLRLYYYRHYGFWNGWLYNADQESRLCYRLSKMQNLPMLAGSLVHKAIEDLLKPVGRGQVTPLERVLERAAKELDLALFQSEQRRWMSDPKRNANLFEHYYGSGIPDDALEAARARILDSLSNFYHSPTFARIRGSDPAGWRSVEEFIQFDLQGTSVAMVMDFAADLGSGLGIYDWKTGGQDEVGNRQLSCYAVFAQQQWGYSLDQIRCQLFYLRENYLPGPFQLSEPERAQIIADIVESADVMQSYLVDPANNVARKQDFPMTDDMARCTTCFFQELCPEPGKPDDNRR